MLPDNISLHEAIIHSLVYTSTTKEVSLIVETNCGNDMDGDAFMLLMLQFSAVTNYVMAPAEIYFDDEDQRGEILRYEMTENTVSLSGQQAAGNDFSVSFLFGQLQVTCDQWG